MQYDMSKYGNSITNDIVSEKIANDLSEICNTEQHIELNFENITVITTTCVKSIFKILVEKVGSDNFFSRFSFLKANENIQIIITQGIAALY